MGKVVTTGSGGGLKVLNWNLHSFQPLEIIQGLASISWVRCASGNVYTSGIIREEKYFKNCRCCAMSLF